MMDLSRLHRHPRRTDAMNALQPALFDLTPGVEAGRIRPAPRKLAPPLALCVLGSGSGGNCSVLRHRGPDGTARHLLIDAGFGPRTTAHRLAQVGLTLADLSGVCVTHFDQDHFRRSWCRMLVTLGVPLFCHRWHLPDLARFKHGPTLLDAGLVKPFDDTPFTPLPGLTARPLRVQHDRQGTIAYRFDNERSDIIPPRSKQTSLELELGREHRESSASASASGSGSGSPSADRYPGGALSLGYATDLGHAPAAFLLHMAGVDLLAIESNYDEHMTKTSARPAFVNRRNLSDSGHLSNDQCLAAVRAIGELSPHGNPRRVVLLHRSDQCNHPTKVHRCFAQEPGLLRRVSQTQQRRRSRWFSVPPLAAVRRCQITLAAAG